MFKVYWTDSFSNAQSENTNDLRIALSTAEFLRKKGMTFVTLVSENENSVGNPGVDEVKDGKCPDGVVYDWNKESRIGAMRK